MSEAAFIARIQKAIDKVNGDTAEVAYWMFKMLTDPTQGSTRDANGYAAERIWSERDAFKEIHNLFTSLTNIPPVAK